MTDEEKGQTLLDQAAYGTRSRRQVLGDLSSLGGASLVSSFAIDQAFAAASNQRDNRNALKSEYDFIIIGAGAAGCVLASELSATGATVLIVESGGTDQRPEVERVNTWYTNSGGPMDWSFRAQPSRYLNGRSIPVGMGRVLGGGTSINAMMWVRGLAQDFDSWSSGGCDGWSFKEILPYYRRLESWEGGANVWRGGDGPLQITRPQNPHPTATHWLEASREMGIPVLDDLNGPMKEGSGLNNMTIGSNGVRMSASRCFLRPVLSRPNVTLLLNCNATKLIVENGRCLGAELSVDGISHTVRSSREVIVSAGGIASAKLLMLSGVGPADALKRLGIATVADLAGVGQNFQDHPVLQGVIERYRGQMPPPSMNSNVVEATAFVRSSTAKRHPDLQLTLFQLPVTTEEIRRDYGNVAQNAFTIAPGVISPSSRGSVKLADADWRSAPILDTGFLSTEQDLQAMIRCIHLCRELGNQKAYSSIRESEAIPGRKLTVEELYNFARNATTSYYHPVGTCKMGTDQMSVVDPQLRVHGVDRLRVCDASVMPTITSGNTQAPSYMIGLKGADLIKKTAS